MNLSNDVMGVFEHIGMMSENNMGDLVAVVVRMKPGLHSSVSLKVCDYAMSARYLTLYNEMIDKIAGVLFNANQKDGKLEAKIEYVPSTKIGSNRKALLQKKKNAKNGSDFDS
eukprot:13894278-Ditylum_brightwellii.AAC.1